VIAGVNLIIKNVPVIIGEAVDNPCEKTAMENEDKLTKRYWKQKVKAQRNLDLCIMLSNIRVMKTT
jgi:hypothetical protein